MRDNSLKGLAITVGAMLAVAFLMFYVQPLWYGIRFGVAFVYNLGVSAFGDLQYDGQWGALGYTWQHLLDSTEVLQHTQETYQKAFFFIGATFWLASSRLSVVYVIILLAGTITGVFQ